MTLSTNKQLESYENAKICYICKEKFEYKYTKDKKYHKLGNIEVLHIAYAI